MKLSNVTPRILANAKRTSCAGHSKRKGLKQERRAITDTLRSELSDPVPLDCQQYSLGERLCKRSLS